MENFLPLRQELMAEGHCFSSDTDTEVIAHLVEGYLVQGHDLEAAIKQALSQIRGAHSIVVLGRQEPDRLDCRKRQLMV